MNKTAFLALAGLLSAIGLVLMIIIGRSLLRAEQNVTPAPQVKAMRESASAGEQRKAKGK